MKNYCREIIFIRIKSNEVILCIVGINLRPVHTEMHIEFALGLNWIGPIL